MRLIPPPLLNELAHVEEVAENRAVDVSAALPVQVRPVAEILDMGRAVLLDLSEMEPSGRERVSELAGGLLREMHGTADLLPPGGEKLRLIPEGVGEDGLTDRMRAERLAERQEALTRFKLALDGLTEGEG